MSCPHPTAQYGQTPANAFASLILSETAAASTGSMSTPAPSAVAPAVAPPYFRKSRRERLMGVSFSPLWARELVPDASDDNDAARPGGRSFELDDVARIQRGEVGRTIDVVGKDEGLLGARELGTGVGGALHPDRLAGRIHRNDDVAILLEGVGQTHRLGPLRVESGTKAGVSAGRHPRRSDRLCQDCTTAYSTVLGNVSASRRLARPGHTGVAARQGGAPPRRVIPPATASRSADRRGPRPSPSATCATRPRARPCARL